MIAAYYKAQGVTEQLLMDVPDCIYITENLVLLQIHYINS